MGTQNKRSIDAMTELKGLADDFVQRGETIITEARGDVEDKLQMAGKLAQSLWKKQPALFAGGLVFAGLLLGAILFRARK